MLIICEAFDMHAACSAVSFTHIGNEYRKAIERYYLSGPRQYPRTLADLLKDPRQPGTVRYLRKLYPDPITGAEEWASSKAPTAASPASTASRKPRPSSPHGFAVRDKEFEEKTKYSDWKFIYSPATAPGIKPPPPAAKAEKT
jgi:hypothetical protein